MITVSIDVLFSSYFQTDFIFVCSATFIVCVDPTKLKPIGTSVIYPSTQKYRVSMPVELREGYEICVRNSVLQAEIAMLATSYSEALLRGKEQLNQYVCLK